MALSMYKSTPYSEQSLYFQICIVLEQCVNLFKVSKNVGYVS